ncbi:hypothetical protein ACFL0L_03785 [Patescibacteria group bacterium]
MKEERRYRFPFTRGDDQTGLEVGNGGFVDDDPLEPGLVITLEGVTEVTFAA